jgi:signal transduction histidine kinase
LISALVYWRTRDLLYGFFLGLCLAWLVRISFRLVITPLLPPILHTAILNTSYLFYAGFAMMFAVELFGIDRRWYVQRIGGLVLVLVTVTFFTTLMGMEAPYTASLAIASVAGVLFFGYTVWRTVRDFTWERGLFSVAVTGNAMAAVRDFALIRTSGSGLGAIEASPVAVILYTLVLAVILAERYVHSQRNYIALNRDLASRISQRENELAALYNAQQVRDRDSAVREERGRIMRDMHDGLGARLVTLLGSLRSGKAAPNDMQHQVQESLDELRLTIDSLEDTGGDVAALLGNMRYRFEKRFTEHGVRFVWRVKPLPALHYLTPANNLHLQRLLLEVFTNILKHAHAKTVEVSTETIDDAIVVTIADDGVGFDLNAQRESGQGRGLANLRFRAKALGGEVEVRSPAPSFGKGTSVSVHLPLSSP